MSMRRILVLGGSVFVGHALIAAASARGWRVSAFNNDRAWAHVPGVEHIVGDRFNRSEFADLAQRRWDLVLDTWSGSAREVQVSAALLAESAAAYAYVSSLAVYRPTPGHALTEEDPVISGPGRDGSSPYEVRKREAELAVVRAFPSEHLIIRSGLLLGPRERPGRLPWWLDRVRSASEVLAPAPPQHPIQYTDVRDLAAWTLNAAEDERRGTFNFACPHGHATMIDLVEACQAATRSRAATRWVAAEVLRRHGVTPWTGFPLWIPPGADGLGVDVYNVDVSRALSAGARFRPLSETVADTESWLRGLVSDPAGLSPETRVGRMTRAQEEAILANIH
jgi:2'-hydroxyisoflavone reductase